jgi:hypothetical protein
MHESGSAGSEMPGSKSTESRPVSRLPGSRSGARFAACLAAGALALGAGFGIAKVVDQPGAAPLSSAIPSPAKSGGVFVEDDDGTAQDSQTNILQSTGPGLGRVPWIMGRGRGARC